MLASPYVLTGDHATAGFRLFESGTKNGKVQMHDGLHLRISTRSIRAQRISDGVDALLCGESARAAAVAELLPVRPMLTRSLSTARAWLERNRRGMTRSGLVTSTYAARIRADGLESDFELHRGFEWEHWFLDIFDCHRPDCSHKHCNDVRTSSRLEVAATQFEIQGLELDWVGGCLLGGRLTLGKRTGGNAVDSTARSGAFYLLSGAVKEATNLTVIGCC